MRRFLPAASLVLLSAATAFAQDGQPLEPHHLAGVPVADPAVRAALAVLGIPVEHVRSDGTAEIVVTDTDLRLLAGAGLPVTMLQPELERFYAERLAAEKGMRGIDPPFGSGSMGGYHTLAEMEAILDQFHADFPAITTPKSSVGLSVEGRNLWAMVISDNPLVDEPEPEVRFDSLIHAREPVSFEMTLFFMDWLLTGYGTDPLATFLVDERELYFVVIQNPDGYEYNRQTNPGGGGMWRKNRRYNGSGVYGVDLNRNFSFQWGYDNSGSSPNPSSETYRGPAPASEPEVLAMEAFITARSFAVANSAHTYSNLWLYPWGYTCAAPPNQTAHDLIGQYFTEQSNYVFGSICPTLYAANGVTVDYDFGVHGTFSGTVEIGSGSDGFWPPLSRLMPLMQENLRGYQRLALYGGAGLEGGAAATWTESAGDGDPWFEPGETFDLVFNLVNAGTAATTGSLTAAAVADNASVTILDGAHDFGVVPAFTAANNAAAPLRFQVDAAAPTGAAVTVTASLSWDGYTEAYPFPFTIGQPRTLTLDDLEADHGWLTGLPGDTAATGKWQRADPEGTTSGGQNVQPANDHTAAGTLCAVTDGRAGAGAGTYDVDSGYTTLWSPQFDLEDAVQPVLSYWRWYADFTTPDDVFLVEVSNDDGASWVTVEALGTTQNAWNQASFRPADFLPLSDTMRLKFVAQDDPNNSLVEAAVDDLGVSAFQGGRAWLVRYGTPQANGLLRLELHGLPGERFILYAATAGAWYDLGDLGVWELDFATLVRVLSASLDSQGDWALATVLDPAFSGLPVHLQAFVVAGPAGVYVTNAVDFVIQ